MWIKDDVRGSRWLTASPRAGNGHDAGRYDETPVGCGRCAGGSGQIGRRGCGEANLGWRRWAALGATTRTTTRTMLTDEMDDDGERERRRMGNGRVG
jgi:hypothetical protein